jgi:hypothetical protein
VPNVKKIRGLKLPGTPWATSAFCGRPLALPGKYLGQFTRFEAVMEVLMKIPHFWEMTPCGLYVGTRVLVELAAFILRFVQEGLLHCLLGVLRK